MNWVMGEISDCEYWCCGLYCCVMMGVCGDEFLCCSVVFDL